MAKRWLLVGLVFLLSLVVVGCGISQEEYDAVLAERDGAQAQVAPLQRDLADKLTQIAALQTDYDKVVSDITESQAQLATVQSDCDKVSSDLAELQDEIDVLQTHILSLYATLPTTALPTTEVEVIHDIEYGNAGGISLLLDMYIPETPIVTPMPAIIYMHGGSWLAGDKSDPSRVRSIRALAQHGFFAVSINYRLSGVAKFPAQVEDSKCAVRWLRANAEEYNVDPDRIGVWGDSAGGHLAMMVGVADETAGLEGNGGWEEYSSQVQAVCSYYGVSDLVSPYKELGKVESSVVIAFLGGTYKENSGIYEAASPISYVTANDPPLLLVHGDSDQTVPIYHSEDMYEAYQQAGLEATLIEVTGADHGFRAVTSNPISPSLDEIEQTVLEFFIKHLLLI